MAAIILDSINTSASPKFTFTSSTISQPNYFIVGNYIHEVTTANYARADYITSASATAYEFVDPELHWTTSDFAIVKASIAKNHIKTNLLIRSSSKSLSPNVSSQEQKARMLLRDLLSEKEWRRYITNGFIMVRGQSGRWYQVFNNTHERIRVYEKGNLLHSLCIHSDKGCPPTDHVINMKIMVETDENLLANSSNKYEPSLLDSGFVNAVKGNLLSITKMIA